LNNIPEGKFILVTCGYDFSVAIREDGTLAAWGDNEYNQLNVPEGKFI
jgi:alpha-tubulin suppressor-like RCC1 family protein